MSREAFPLYPLVWRPDQVPHESSLRGRLFAMEEIDPSPGLGATSITALVIRCEDESWCVDVFGRRTKSLKGQAIRVPMAYGLERLQPLIIAQDGSPSKQLAMIELVAVHVPVDGSLLYFVAAYVHNDPLLDRAAMPPPERYSFDLVEQARAYSAQLADPKPADAVPVEAPTNGAASTMESTPRKTEQGPSDTPRT